MPAIAFDTLKFIRALIAVGFSEQQANAMTDLQRETFDQVLTHHVAGKDDIHFLIEKMNINKLDVIECLQKNTFELRQEISVTKLEITQVKTELQAHGEQIQIGLRGGNFSGQN